MWIKDPIYGTDIWAMIKRKELAQKPLLDKITKQGIWDIDEITKEHNLRSNCYDGVSLVIAMYKRELYIEWCNSIGKSVLPFDSNWWSGWKEFTVSNPNYYNDIYKEEELKRINEWRISNGYETIS